MYTGLPLSVVPFIHLSFCLSVLFCSLHKAIYISSATAGVKSDFLTVLVLFLAVPRRLFCFGSLVILDVVCRYLSLFLLYINIKIDKNRC